jgi:hypothetical protein
VILFRTNDFVKKKIEIVSFFAKETYYQGRSVDTQEDDVYALGRPIGS